jgi:dienelactone hydrolase
VTELRQITYEADGREMIGTLAIPDGTDARPGILVAHEGPGIADITRDFARRLAEAGYVAFALDYHGGGTPIADRTEMMERLVGLIGDVDRTRALASAGLAVLLADDRVDRGRIAAIGFCFGGTMALELARGGADVKAVVGFHSGLGTPRPEDAAGITGKVLVCIGTEDPLIPPEERAAFEVEMRAAGVDWRMNLYGGAAHSFTNPDARRFGIPGVDYHEPTAQRSWRAMIDLFDEVFT